MEGKIDPSRFLARPGGAGEALAADLDDRVAPQDFAGDGGWRGAAVGDELCSDRRHCSNGALGHSGDRSKTAGRR